MMEKELVRLGDLVKYVKSTLINPIYKVVDIEKSEPFSGNYHFTLVNTELGSIIPYFGTMVDFLKRYEMYIPYEEQGEQLLKEGMKLRNKWTGLEYFIFEKEQLDGYVDVFHFKLEKIEHGTIQDHYGTEEEILTDYDIVFEHIQSEDIHDDLDKEERKPIKTPLQTLNLAYMSALEQVELTAPKKISVDDTVSDVPSTEEVENIIRQSTIDRFLDERNFKALKQYLKTN